MALDKEVQAELQRAKNRTLDFNPEIATSVPTARQDVSGVDNASVFLSAGTNYHYVVYIDGVPFRTALTSAF